VVAKGAAGAGAVRHRRARRSSGGRRRADTGRAGRRMSKRTRWRMRMRKRRRRRT
jgi:hypothetical protein